MSYEHLYVAFALWAVYSLLRAISLKYNPDNKTDTIKLNSHLKRPCEDCCLYLFLSTKSVLFGILYKDFIEYVCFT